MIVVGKNNLKPNDRKYNACDEGSSLNFSYECFYTITNILFKRSMISLDPLFGHYMSNIPNIIIMYRQSSVKTFQVNHVLVNFLPL